MARRPGLPTSDPTHTTITRRPSVTFTICGRSGRPRSAANDCAGRVVVVVSCPPYGSDLAWPAAVWGGTVASLSVALTGGREQGTLGGVGHGSEGPVMRNQSLLRAGIKIAVGAGVPLCLSSR
jgi:hypothetical protein